MIERLVFGTLLMGLPIALLVREGKRTLEEEKERSSAPFTEKLLRPPGESLRLKIEEIQDKMLTNVLTLMSFIVFPAMLVMQTPIQSSSGRLIAYLSIPCACYAVAIRKWQQLRSLRSDLRNYRLGFDGERYIASELEPLLAHGYRVFHDFVVDSKPGGDETTFNIDHIAIGPGGDFSIETKARRKQKNDGKNVGVRMDYTNGKLTQHIDGRATDRDAWIAQAKRNAIDLGKWLAPRGESPVSVQPVLVVPGWKVDSDKQEAVEVYVFSGRNVAKTILSRAAKAVLTEKQIKDLAQQLDRHCRSIESI